MKKYLFTFVCAVALFSQSSLLNSQAKAVVRLEPAPQFRQTMQVSEAAIPRGKVVILKTDAELRISILRSNQPVHILRQVFSSNTIHGEIGEKSIFVINGSKLPRPDAITGNLIQARVFGPDLAWLTAVSEINPLAEIGALSIVAVIRDTQPLMYNPQTGLRVDVIEGEANWKFKDLSDCYQEAKSAHDDCSRDVPTKQFECVLIRTAIVADCNKWFASPVDGSNQKNSRLQ